jgi:hypothetical protein
MAKSYFRLPAKELKTVISELLEEGVLVESESGCMLQSDMELLKMYSGEAPDSVYAMHRNDFLVRSNEHWLKEKFKHPEYETLYYLLIDGQFRGAVVGKFRNGPYDLEDVILNLTMLEEDNRKQAILDAVRAVSHGRTVTRYLGENI